MPTDRRTLQSNAAPNVFALGDATDLPTSKAGSVTHFEAEVLTENIARFLAGQELEAGFDGHANCFIETGFHKALLIDFNYDTEPLPGRSRPRSGRFRSCASHGSTTSGSSCSSGSTGTGFCPDEKSRASARDAMAGKTPPATP